MTTRYIGGKEDVAWPLPPAAWDALPVEAQALILALLGQVVGLQTEVAALHAQCRELQARMRWLLWRGEESLDHKAAALCRDLNSWWPALWTVARVERVEPTNNVAERLLTVVASCRQQGRQLLDFPVAAGAAALQGRPAPSLVPAPRWS